MFDIELCNTLELISSQMKKKVSILIKYKKALIILFKHEISM